MEGDKNQQALLALLKNGKCSFHSARAVAYWLRCLAALGFICMRAELHAS